MRYCYRLFPDDDQNGKSSDDKVDNTAAQSNSVNNEEQNGKSAAGRGRKQKRQLWEYEPAVDSASKYWDVGVEGKRTRTLNKASYAEEDARSDSEEDPEDLFKPQREEESYIFLYTNPFPFSLESWHEARGKEKIETDNRFADAKIRGSCNRRICSA
jgi:hypothetical protein